MEVSGRYYRLATVLRPEVGTPYSQLATLAGDQDKGVKRLYYYLRHEGLRSLYRDESNLKDYFDRCVTSKEGFEGGEANMNRLFDKCGSLSECSSLETSLVHLCRLVLGSPAPGVEEVTLACQHSLARVLHSLEEDPSPEWVCMVVTCLKLLLHRLRTSSSPSLSLVSLLQAWLLALTSHMAHSLVARLGPKVWGQEWQLPEVTKLEVKEEQQQLEVAEEVKKRKSKLDDFLRRRRAPNSGSEGEDSGESSDEIFESDTDEEDLTENCLADSSDSDRELDVVIEEDSSSSGSQAQLPPGSVLVSAAESSGLLAPLRLARLFTVLDLSAPDRLLLPAPAMEPSHSCVPLWEDWLLRGLPLQGLQELSWASPTPSSGLDPALLSLSLTMPPTCFVWWIN